MLRSQAVSRTIIAEDGAGIMDYIFRVHFYAGKSYVRVLHTFLIASDTRTTVYPDIALVTSLLAGDGRPRASFGKGSKAENPFGGPIEPVNYEATRFTDRALTPGGVSLIQLAGVCKISFDEASMT